MRKRLHLILGVLFVLAFLCEAVFWAGAAALPDVGRPIRQSVQREAPLVLTYTVSGEVLGKIVPTFVGVGEQWASAAFEPGYQRIKDDPNVTAALIFGNTWNGTHRLAKAGIYGTPLLLALALLAWFLRPKQVRLMGSRR